MMQVRLLFLAANPSEQTRLALDEEARAIEEKLRGARFRDHLAVRTRWAVRPDDLIQYLNEDEPHIVHFSGHGSTLEGISLHTASEGMALVGASELVRLFTVLRKNITIVVLNSCHSEAQATAIASVVDVVIGMKSSIRDDAARTFAASFYRALAFGVTVQNAFEQGQMAIALELDDKTQAEIPVLLARSGIDPSKVVLVGSEAPLARLAVAARNPEPASPAPWVRIGDVDEPLNARPDLITPQLGREFLEQGLDVLKLQRTDWRTLTVALFDIDYLTQINKRFGRVVGNRVLIKVGRLIQARRPIGAIVGRCGDDTFFYVCPDQGFELIRDHCVAVLKSIKDHDWWGLAEGLHVSCSCGVADLQEGESPSHTAIRAALGYQRAKEAGGNQVSPGPRYLGKGQGTKLHDHVS